MVTLIADGPSGLFPTTRILVHRCLGPSTLYRLTGMMHLAHRQAAPRSLLPFAQPQFELAEPPTVRLGRPVLHPQQLARDVLVAPQVLINLGPVGQRAACRGRGRRV